MSEPFIAEIRIFAGTFAIRNWAFCDGLLISISQNPALFSILGTTYGGDGRTTFGLPDLRGRLALHPGTGPGLTTRRLGERSGAADVTLAASQLPAHGHSLSAVAAQADMTLPVANTTSLGATPGGMRSSSIYGPVANLVDMASQSVASTGGGQPHNNEQPYLALNFLIALFGVFPSRS